MLFLIQMVLVYFGLSSITESDEDLRYMILFEAGSTFTRTYIFWTNTQSSEVDFQYKEGIQLTPELASQSSSSVYKYFRPALIEAANLIPASEYSKTEIVMFFATDESDDVQIDDRIQSLYNRFSSDAQQDRLQLFNIKSSNVELITASDKGYYTTLALNYDRKGLSKDLELTGQEIFGLLNIDESNGIQLAFDIMGRWRVRQSHRKRRKFDAHDIFLHGFTATYGSTSMFERLTQDLIEQHKQGTGVSNTTDHPCLFLEDKFVEYEAGEANVALHGSGNATLCIENVQKMITLDNHACAATQIQLCSLESVPLPQSASGHFIGLGMISSAFTFAHEILRMMPRSEEAENENDLLPLSPTIVEIERAAERICGLSMTQLLELQKQSQAPQKMISRRCFDLCYALAIIKQVLKHEWYDRRLNFITSSEDLDAVHWSVGAYLATNVQLIRAKAQHLESVQVKHYQEGLPFARKMVLMLFLSASYVLYRDMKRTSRRRTYKSFRFRS